MGILAKRFPEYGVTLQIYRNMITREDWMEYFAGFTAADTSRFITYVDPSTDMSGTDLASAPELKRVIAAKLREFFGDEPVVSIVVPGSKAQEPDAKFWCSFERVGEKHPTESVIVSNLKEACDLLGLPEEASKKLAAAIEC